MISLAPRSCLDLTPYDSEMLHDESNVLKSRLVKFKKYKVEEAERATEALLLIVFCRIASVAQNDSVGCVPLLHVAINS